MDLISIGAGLICLIGACAGLAFLAEEGMSTTWTGLEDVNRWVKVKLDSIGQLAELDSDWDLETGAMGDWLIPEVCGVVLMGYGCVATRSVFRFGDPREASLAAGEPQAVSLPRPHGGPVRRSVHRQVAGGVSAAATPGDASRGRLSEFGKFFEGPSNDQRDQYGSSPGHGSGVNAHAVASPLPAALPLRPQLSEGAVSGDAKAARLADLRHGAGSFSGGVRGVRQDADGVVEGDGAHNVLDHSRSRAPYYGRNAQGGSAGARGMPEPSRAAATPGTSTRAPADQVRWDEEQRIPMYVPDQKQGYLSQATHRRTSSRSLGVEIDAWDAVGGDHGRGIGVASIADNAAPQSPFVLSRCSPDRRHPASAFGASFTGLSRSGAEADVDAPSSSSMSLGDDESLPPQSDGVLGMREEMRELLVRSDRGQALDSRGPTVQRVSQSGRSVPETAEDDTVARLNVARGKNASISASARSPLIGSSCVEDDWLGQAAAEVARGESGLYGGKGSPGLADGKAMTPLLNMDASGTPGLPDVAARSVFWNEDVDEESSRGAEGVDDAGGGEGNFSPHSPSWPMPPYDRTFTGVRRRVSPRASQQYLEGGGGWAPASPVRAEGGWEGGEGRPRSVSLFASQDVSSGGGNEFLGSSANDPLPSARARYSTVDQAERTSASVWLRENPKVEAGCAAGGLGSAAREGGPMASGREIAVSTSYSLPSPAGVLSSPLPDPSRNLAGISPGGPRIVGGARSGDSSPRPGLSSSSADGGARPPAAEEEGEKDTGSEGVERCVQAPTGAMCHVLGADVTAAAAAAAAAAVAGGGGDRDTPAGLLHSSPIFDRDKCLVGNAMVAWNAVERAIPGEVPQGGDRYAREERDLNPALRLSERQDLHVPFEELELTQVIGGGCSGQVYRGAWKGTPVAIKVLVPMPEGDSEEKKWASFVAEVQMLAALRHPNVCLFMGACVTPPNRAIVTELVSRGSLWQALRNPVLPLDLASQSDAAGGSGSRHPRHLGHFRTPEDCWPWSIILKVAEGMACGMNYLHRHEPVPILHRDLKSANVLLDDAFGVKICDFGMARLKALTSSMTGNCGTVQWMAPEVLTSQKYTETADVYSFAVVCWELLTRACPYEGMSQIQVAVAVINDGLRPDIPAWCPEEFRALIEACWDGDPGKRGEFEAILRFLRQSS